MLGTIIALLDDKDVDVSAHLGQATSLSLAAIALVIAFFVVMWLPTHPLWLILTVSVVFVVGVLSLFFTAGNYRNNPNLDANGTAV